MLRSKHFWIAVVITVLFIVVWVKYSLAAAIGMLIGVGLLSLIIFGGRRSRRRRYIVYDDYDEDEDQIIVERRPQSRSSSSDRVRDLYFPRGLRNVHQDGLNELGRRQRDDLNRTLRRLRR